MASIDTMPPSEPGVPSAGIAEDLPPKSYAQAAEQNLSGHTETKVIPTTTPIDSNGPPNDTLITQKVAVNGDGKPMPNVFEFTGFNGNNQANGLSTAETTPFEFTGQGEDHFPRSPTKKPGHKKSGSLRSINGIKRPAESNRDKEDGDLMIKRSRSSSGDRLTSVKSNKDYADGLRLAEKEKKPAKDLVSGRRAGDGWERSGYTLPSNPTFYSQSLQAN